jgi:hypothetical protein
VMKKIAYTSQTSRESEGSANLQTCARWLSEYSEMWLRQ